MIVLNKKYKRWVFLGSLIIFMAVFFYWQNNGITVSEHKYSNPKIPADFIGYKIVHISDLHNKVFGKDQSKLLSKIENLDPDIIVVTGDLIDRRRFDLEKAMSFIDGAIEIAPIYYVSGNHEAWSGKYPEIKNTLVDSGVNILDDISMDVKKGNSTIKLFGLSDPSFNSNPGSKEVDIVKLEELLKEWSTEEDFKVLLSHRPELFYLYCENQVDLIFAGHAHGGQFRLPFLGAIFAPGQGFFPELTAGSYREKNSTMFVSRGLGNSIIPIRVFNRPEIVSVTFN